MISQEPLKRRFFFYSHLLLPFIWIWIGGSKVQSGDLSKSWPCWGWNALFFPKMCHLLLFLKVLSFPLSLLKMCCTLWPLEQSPSTSALHDPDIDWLLNTPLCMFYERGDGGMSTSEPVLCHWSQRMCSLSGSYLGVTLSRLKLFIFPFLRWSCATWRGRRFSLTSRTHLYLMLQTIAICHVSTSFLKVVEARAALDPSQLNSILFRKHLLQSRLSPCALSNRGKKNSC